MASLIATLTVEGDQKVVRFPNDLPLEAGPVSCEISQPGQIVLTAAHTVSRQDAWIALLDQIAAREPDPDFMRERPMNRVPTGRNLFPDD